MADNIYQRGGIWYGRVWIAGKEHRCSLRTSDEREARNAVERWRKSLTDLSGKSAGARGTWREAVVNWSETIGAMSDADGLKSRVKQRYLESIRMVDPFWSNLQLSQIGRAEIATFVKLRKKGFTRVGPDASRQKISPVMNATIRRDLTALSSVFRAASAAGLTDFNPAKEWDRGVIKERKRVFIPPLPSEIETVLRYAASNGHFQDLIAFAANTGTRMEEAAGVEWRDVRLDRGDVLFPHTKVSRPRVVTLKTPGGDAAAVLAKTTRHIRSQFVFWHGIDGQRYHSVSESFRDIMARAVAGEQAEGREFKRFRFHDLRHAFAVRWLLAGGDIYALSRHLGHTSVKTTEIYLAYAQSYGEAMHRHTDRHTNSGSQPAQFGNGA